MRYPVDLVPDDNGTFLVTVPDLPEATSFGETEVEALARALDAVETAIQGRMADRLAIPAPSIVDGPTWVVLPALATLKIELYRVMLDRGLRKADLARLLDWKPPQIDRLFDLGHASRLDQIEAAFAALGQEVAFTVHPAGERPKAA